MAITLQDLRRRAVAYSLFEPTTLELALEKLGFVQADPIRSPARAQDLMLRHRVRGYQVGDLERRYAELEVEEDVFINYGFIDRPLHSLMHPRPAITVPWQGIRPWPAARRKRAELLLAYVRERGEVHPREVDDHFSHGKVKNFWGGSSNATTQLLDAMHYRGMLRVTRREGGIRIYAARPRNDSEVPKAEMRSARIDALVDAASRLYAPLPAPSLSFLVRRLRFAIPQWHGELKNALQRAKERFAKAIVDGTPWYWPANMAEPREPGDTVRLLAPFDPVVWDRARFEILWGWVYRFEAYTPSHKRQRGYYALPLLWRDRVIGWANLSVKGGALVSETGFVRTRPRDRSFKRELEVELDRFRVFLGLPLAA